MVSRVQEKETEREFGLEGFPPGWLDHCCSACLCICFTVWSSGEVLFSELVGLIELLCIGYGLMFILLSGRRRE